MKYFNFSFIATAIIIATLCSVMAVHGSSLSAVMAALLSVLILGVFEVSFSFDNAVVNAKVLESMSPAWQKAFLTVGILIAVFGMRLLFPIVIVSATTGESFLAVYHMATSDPTSYAEHLNSAHVAISAFGGTFLFLVFLSWMKEDKEHNWIISSGSFIDRIFRAINYSTLAIFIVIAGLISSSITFTLYAFIGMGIYMLIEFIGDKLDVDTATTKAGFSAFIYLEILDASFSFDGVIGAFAISDNIWIIAAGLGIGACFVRSMTLYLVEKKVLSEFIYLEHGAHYAIGILSLLMFTSCVIEVPELIPGLIGLVFIGYSLIESVRAKTAESLS